ncbi:TetR/AcrR family transcriptional regulator [Nonomuraea sp. 3-1Str]|uniref:TetR/AcrR family transcriptional regulator n=1 Tax=Nonomuraea sp. 3-1Str TaxID=2929801 RepID=UPI002854A57D|nr:helix-turn-helix domain-containing protein [Nonomuraea sp. 3-1Str]MDR8411294.1 TetR/AcrR family transcriptional regulator [Nonomuraea sp. 3-1Str]
MSDAAIAKREQIVAAALGVFGRYGYRRTSMDLIAQAARMSRPAVYQHFKGKEEVFRAVGRRIVDDVVEAAEKARHSDRAVAQRLYDVLSVKLDLFSGTVEAEFRAELFTEASVVAEDVLLSFEERYAEVVQGVLTDSADELDLLGEALSAHDAALILLDALAGISQARQEQDVLRARLRQMVELTVRGLTRDPAHRAGPATREPQE